jgi:hypothetical protein
VYDAATRRIRCIGHILNLALHAFLLANSKEALQAAVDASGNASSQNGETVLLRELQTNTDGCAPSQMEEEGSSTAISGTQTRGRGQGRGRGRGRGRRQPDIAPASEGEETTAVTSSNPAAGWSGITPLRKLHSIAVTLRSSAILHSSFKEEVGVCLGIDNDTRWNSWFKVINTAIAKRPKIVNWLAMNSSHFGANSLDVEDWDLLGKTHSFLQPFNQATLMTEKRDSSLSQAIMVMDALMLHFKESRVSPKLHLTANGIHQFIDSTSGR